jgi:hypothetical protein
MKIRDIALAITVFLAPNGDLFAQPAGTGGLPLTPPGTPAPQGSTTTSVPPSGVGADASSSVVNSLAGLTQLASFTVANPGEYRVWNNCNAVFQIVYGPAGNQTVAALSPGAGTGQQGGDTSPEIPWFTGLVAVYGPAGCIAPARHN